MKKQQKRFSFSVDRLEKVPIPAQGRKRYFDSQQPRLGVRVMASGKKSFFLLKRIHGKSEEITLGAVGELTIEGARREANGWLKQFGDWKASGYDGLSPTDKIKEQRSEHSAEAVAEEWLARDVRPRTRTAREVERVLNKEILPSFKGKLITAIGRADVLRLVDKIVDRGTPIMAIETLSVIKRWLNWCVGRGYLEASPVAANTRVQGAEKRSRDRVLSEDELRAVWNAAGMISYPCGPFLRLLLLTAQRRGEVAGMRWADVDIDRALWTLPREQTKADRVHDVPLSGAALEILKSLPRSEGPFVFTNDTKPINSFSKLKKLLDANLTANKTPIIGFTMHDFRRSAATSMAKAGTPPHVLAAILNHSPGSEQGVTAIYNRFRYLDERREALENWARYLVSLAEEKQQKPAANIKKRRA